MKRVLWVWILLSATAVSSMESAVYFDTRSRLGYELTIRSWLRAGFATSVHIEGERIHRQDIDSGGSYGGIDTRANIGLIAPSIDFRATAFTLELGCNPYLSFHDGGPTASSTGRSKFRFAGNWLGSDFYVGRTFRFERFELMPMIYILRYGYSMSESFHSFGYGLLPEGRFALRF
jgi:hypothetical protein